MTGGVLSSLGKGLSAAALGTLLEARNLRIINVKMDPYINVDKETMSPYQHGEVFVTDDGAETDLTWVITNGLPVFAPPKVLISRRVAFIKMCSPVNVRGNILVKPCR